MRDPSASRVHVVTSVAIALVVALLIGGIYLSSSSSEKGSVSQPSPHAIDQTG